MGEQKRGEGINWATTTWNPLRGCARVSAACKSCYAEAVAARFSGPGQPFEGLVHPTTRGWNGIIKLFPEKLSEPLRWTRPRLIFVNSVSDLFGAEDDEIAAIFGAMALASTHTFQTLTKRHAQMRAWFDWLHDRAPSPSGKIAYCIAQLERYQPGASKGRTPPSAWPLANVWLGVTVEDQENANARVPVLLTCKAAVHWVSAEPLLGPIDFTRIEAAPRPDTGAEISLDALTGDAWTDRGTAMQVNLRAASRLDLVVVGGESGPQARPMHPDWARQIRDACLAAGTRYHFKQFGEYAPGPDHGNPVLNARGGAIPSVLVHSPGKHDHVRMLRVGKQQAGRLLDGVLHDDAMTGMGVQHG